MLYNIYNISLGGMRIPCKKRQISTAASQLGMIKKGKIFILLFLDEKTHGVWIMKGQRKEKGYFFILLFLDEKKQKSSDYIIC